jgi:putative tricarboxylic transport membrane protein
VEQSDQTSATGAARKWHVLGFVLLTAAGAYAVAVSLSLGLWRQSSPGEGLFPFITAVAVTGFGLVGLAGLREMPPAPAPSRADSLGATIKRLAAYLAALIFYAAALDGLGFFLSTILVVVFILRIAEGYGWRTTLVIAAGTAVGCHVLFVYWLGAILPIGTLWERLIY